MIGEEPATRSTYIYLLAWACSQECGGTIKGCAEWSDRRWQQTAAVTKAEVEDLCATDMARWDGVDLVLWWYPEEAHAKVIANRENGKRGGRPRKKAKTEPDKRPTETQEKPCGFGSDNHVANPTETQAETEESRVEENREEQNITEDATAQGELAFDEAIDYLEAEPRPTVQEPNRQDPPEDFIRWWDLYGKKIDYKKCLRKWNRLSKAHRQACIEATPAYVERTSDPQYRKNPLTYLNGECWNDEITRSTSEPEEHSIGVQL